MPHLDALERAWMHRDRGSIHNGLREELAEMVRYTPQQKSAKYDSFDGPVGAPKASHVKEVLGTLRDRLEAQLSNGTDRDPSMVRNLQVNMREQLKQIKEALVRIEEGKYGICANCLTVIAAERLVARPYSTLCTDCHNRWERAKLVDIEQA